MKIKKWQHYQYLRKIMEDDAIPAFEKIIAGKTAEKLKNCGVFINTINCKSCDTKHYAGFRGCKSRWCVPCNNKKTKQWLAKLIPIFNDWIEEGGQIHMLNLTMVDQDNLEYMIKTLEDSWRYMQNGDKKFRARFKGRFLGGIRSLEVKRGKYSKKWHAHYHMLVMTKGYSKDYDWTREAWENSLRVITGQPKKLGSNWIKEITKDNVLSGVLETLKYILKPSTKLYESSKDLQEAYDALSGKRQINTWGLLRGLNKKIEEEFDSVEEKKLDTFICQACGCTEGSLNSALYQQLSDTILYDI